ncbi:MAG: type II toxin-antitoxin system RelE/ParE family toxin [Candidatus Schekmanbacteria bacterium]|nr:type II toxin-antitoxin system RelE/ParE family toxin [Candidatus Schekmanbacteria bacterium]
MTFQIRYQKKFLKDLASIPKPLRQKIEALVFEKIPMSSNPFSEFTIEKMTGYDGYYKFRQGDYRIGIFYHNNILEFQRVLHRREIYRLFPSD